MVKDAKSREPEMVYELAIARLQVGQCPGLGLKTLSRFQIPLPAGGGPNQSETCLGVFFPCQRFTIPNNQRTKPATRERPAIARPTRMPGSASREKLWPTVI